MDVKRDGRGSSYDHDSNGAKYPSKFFEGLDHFCLGNQDSVIEGLWSFVFCIDFAKIPSMHPWPFQGNTVDETLGVLVCSVLSFFMYFCLIMQNPNLLHKYKCDKLCKCKLSYYNNYYGRGDTSFWMGILHKNKP